MNATETILIDAAKAYRQAKIRLVAAEKAKRDSFWNQSRREDGVAVHVASKAEFARADAELRIAEDALLRAAERIDE